MQLIAYLTACVAILLAAAPAVTAGDSGRKCLDQHGKPNGDFNCGSKKAGKRHCQINKDWWWSNHISHIFECQQTASGAYCWVIAEECDIHDHCLPREKNGGDPICVPK